MANSDERMKRRKKTSSRTNTSGEGLTFTSAWSGASDEALA
jgi:hypothetical protein